MAKETKAQRLEREQALREAIQSEMEATYPQRLMDLLERVSKLNAYRLTVENGLFMVEERNSADYWSFSLAYSPIVNDAIDNLLWDVERKEAEVREAERRANLRRSALAKLTDEERKELGL